MASRRQLDASKLTAHLEADEDDLFDFAAPAAAPTDDPSPATAEDGRDVPADDQVASQADSPDDEPDESPQEASVGEHQDPARGTRTEDTPPPSEPATDDSENTAGTVNGGEGTSAAAGSHRPGDMVRAAAQRGSVEELPSIRSLWQPVDPFDRPGEDSTHIGLRLDKRVNSLLSRYELWLRKRVGKKPSRTLITEAAISELPQDPHLIEQEARRWVEYLQPASTSPTVAFTVRVPQHVRERVDDLVDELRIECDLPPAVANLRTVTTVALLRHISSVAGLEPKRDPTSAGAEQLTSQAD